MQSGRLIIPLTKILRQIEAVAVDIILKVELRGFVATVSPDDMNCSITENSGSAGIYIITNEHKVWTEAGCLAP